MKQTTSRVHFDRLARNYNSYKHPYNLYYNTLKFAVKRCISHTTPRILDIGCGTGNMLAYLHPSHGEGIDISSEMIKIARRAYPQFDFRVHDITKAPYPGRFDYILFNDVIEHVADHGLTIKNLARTMTRQSTLILSMANPAWEPLLMIMERVKLKMPEGPHHRISENELFKLLSKHHLSVVQKQVYFPQLPHPFTGLGLIYVYLIQTGKN